MKRQILILAVLILSIFLVAGNAMALAINSNRPYTDIDTSWDAPGNLLQDIFNAKISNGSLDAKIDQSNVALWMPAEADVSSYLITMVAGDTGVLGLYSATTGLEYDLVLGANNAANFGINDYGALYINGSLADAAFGNDFGFYWKNIETPLMSYTEDDKNSNNGYGVDSNILALTYLVPDEFKVLTAWNGGTTVTAQGDNDWILAFEDRIPSNGDGDFNDAVFYIEDMKPVPEPATMMLLGFGLIGVGVASRKKLFKK